MSSSIIFVGSGFFVVSAIQQVPGTVRVHFSAPAQAINPLNANDAQNPSNYAFTGPGFAVISAVNPVLGNPLSFDVVMSSLLAPGMWTVTVSNVKTNMGAALVAPTAANFFVTASAQTSLTAGAETDTSERVIRKHLNRSLKGDGWNALISGLSQGDDKVWGFAQSAYDQLFLSTATGTYLEKRASDIGITKPAGVGINEEVFRKFAIKNNANKVVQEALRETLEAFYGIDSLRAYAETELDETFNLSGNPTLEWLLDELEFFSYTFTSTNFASSTKARALEVAVQLTKHMQDLGSKAFAIAFQSAETGKFRVRIYSGSLGLRSAVRITGGTAQNFFHFPTYVEVYSSDITIANGYTWVVGQPDQDTTSFALTTPGIAFVNMTPVQIGDYVIIGTDAQQGVTGVFTVKNVEIFYSGTSAVQRFSIEKVETTGSGIQASNDAYRFFRPKKCTTNAGTRTVVVSQSVDGRIDVQIPATTLAVSRGPKTAFYGNLNESDDIIAMTRSPQGIVSVTTADAHGLQVDDQVIFEGVQPTQYRPFVYSTPLPPDTFSGWLQQQNMPVSNSDVIIRPRGRQSFFFPVAPAISRIGKLQSWLFAGGAQKDGQSVGGMRLNDLGGSTVVNTGSEADGQIQKSFTLQTAGIGPLFYGLQATPLGEDKVIVTGGGTLIGADPSSGYTNAITVYDGTANTSSDGGAALYQRVGHQQVNLEDLGVCVVIGGAIIPGMATVTAEKSFIGNGAYSGFTSANNVNTMSVPRCDFRAIPISKNEIMVIGGRMLGRESPFSSGSMLAQWKFNDPAGSTTLADESTVYNLTLVNSPTQTWMGKINGAWDFTPANSYATSPGDVAAVNVLQGEWTITWWAKNVTGPGVHFSYGGTGSDADPTQNVQIRVDQYDGSHITWMWENGAGNDVTGTCDRALSLYNPNSNLWAHYAIRKRLNQDGSTFDVDIFIDGVMIGHFPQQINCDGGSAGAWFMARDCELPDGPTNGWPGLLDEFTVFKSALNSAGIVAEWERGSGEYQGPNGPQSRLGDAGSPKYGEITNRVDIYNAATDLWTEIAPMNMCRAFHEAFLLDDGRVLVIGGAGREPTQLPQVFGGEDLPPLLSYEFNPSVQMVVPNLGITPNRALRECEIYDPASGTWQFTSSMGIPRKGIVGRKDGDKITIFGGVNHAQPNGIFSFPGGSYPPTHNAEILDLKTMTWRTSPARSLLLRDGGDSFQDREGDVGDGSETTKIAPLDSGISFIVRDLNGYNIFAYTPDNFSNTDIQPHEVYIPGSSVISSGGLNGQFRVASVPSPTQFTVETVERPEDLFSMNVRSGDNGYYRIYGNPIHVVSLQRTGGSLVTATVTNVVRQFLAFGLGIQTKTLVNPTASLRVGDLVQVNVSESTDFLSGRKIILSVPSTTTFTYFEPGNNVTQTVEAGASVLRSTPDEVAVGAVANGPNDQGPYLFDPDGGLSITDTEATLYDAVVNKNQQYGEIEVTVTQGSFPDKGFLIFEFGYDDQSIPIQYLSKYTTAPGRLKLVLDYRYIFEFAYLQGAKITLMNSRTSFQPQSLVGSAYITGSVAGRTAAKAAVNAAIAAGVDPNIKIVYPGDRGLGGEGYPTSSAAKVSDAVTVWAGDEIDQEVQDAENGD